MDAWKITKLFESNRLGHKDKSWFPAKQGSHFIMFAQSITASPQFHRSVAQDWPIVVKSAVTEIGKTSVTVTAQILNGNKASPMVYAERKFRLVCMDMETRKSTELLPDFHAIHTAYAKKCGEAGKFPTFDQPNLDKAENISSITNIVRHSDLDLMFHTNQGIYFKLSQDCASVAAEGGKLKQFNKDMCFYPIQQADVLHKGESFPGDELVVHSWEDSNLNMTMNFVITKQEKEIFYARFKYYQEELENI